MTNSSHPVIHLTDLGQVCIVVRDVDKSVDSMWNTFGIGPWSIYVMDSSSMSNMTYRGKPGRFSFKVARTISKLGGIEIELIQPVEGSNIYADFLKEHGEGIQHVGWYKVNSLAVFVETTQMLEKAGFPCMMSARGPRGHFAYFDTTKALNTVLELILPDPSAKPPPSSRAFP
jgi:methylmalonyl-CoA/ethylmalonyl-CoA epimerase